MSSASSLSLSLYFNMISLSLFLTYAILAQAVQLELRVADLRSCSKCFSQVFCATYFSIQFPCTECPDVLGRRPEPLAVGGWGTPELRQCPPLEAPRPPRGRRHGPAVGAFTSVVGPAVGAAAGAVRCNPHAPPPPRGPQAWRWGRPQWRNLQIQIKKET